MTGRSKHASFIIWYMTHRMGTSPIDFAAWRSYCYQLYCHSFICFYSHIFYLFLGFHRYPLVSDSCDFRHANGQYLRYHLGFLSKHSTYLCLFYFSQWEMNWIRLDWQNCIVCDLIQIRKCMGCLTSHIRRIHIISETPLLRSREASHGEPSISQLCDIHEFDVILRTPRAWGQGSVSDQNGGM